MIQKTTDEQINATPSIMITLMVKLTFFSADCISWIGASKCSSSSLIRMPWMRLDTNHHQLQFTLQAFILSDSLFFFFFFVEPFYTEGQLVTCDSDCILLCDDHLQFGVCESKYNSPPQPNCTAWWKVLFLCKCCDMAEAKGRRTKGDINTLALRVGVNVTIARAGGGQNKYKWLDEETKGEEEKVISPAHPIQVSK